ncbi:MAG TPA: alpha-amylase family protein [Cyclobacteriaceae bacterium]|nr:alpha-amylase family protein [Cyclobacteriaceae bacterium]
MLKSTLLLALSAIALFSCHPDVSMKPIDETYRDSNMLSEKPEAHKISVYQLLTRLYSHSVSNNIPYGTMEENGVGKMNDITSTALESIKKLGVTHVWFTGILECATMSDFSSFGIIPDNPFIVKGRAGSPYAIKDYYDVNPELAVDVTRRKEEYKALIERTHDVGLKVIMDFVPNHVARQYKSDAKPDGVKDLGEGDDISKAFSPSNNFYYLPGSTLKVPEYNPLGERKAPHEDAAYVEKPAKVSGNNVFNATPSLNDWYETVKLNYGLEPVNNTIDLNNEGSKHFTPTPSTWVKMKDILLYWAQFGVDGFRCDIAEMVPVEFWQYAITEVKKSYPDVIFIAEIYNPDQYRNYIQNGRFDYLYDKVGTYDAIRRVVEGKGTLHDVSAVRKNLDGISGHMLRFLENHDEQRFASRFFAGNALRCAPAMVLTTCMHTGPQMIYFGQESGVKAEGAEGFGGDDGRTTIFDYWGVTEHQAFTNGGKFDGGKYTSEQSTLRAFYARLLNLSLSSDAITQGYFYELQHTHDSYNSDLCYSFLRYTNNQRLLVVTNFSNDKRFTPSLRLSDEALKAIGADANTEYTLHDLLSDFELHGNLKKGIPVELAQNSAFIFEIR